MSIKTLFRKHDGLNKTKQQLQKELDMCRQIGIDVIVEKCKLLGDINLLEEQVYNLTLYLKKVEERFPSVFKYLVSEFDGMPGYGLLAEDESD